TQIDNNTHYQIDFEQRHITFAPVRIDAQIRDKTAGIDTTATLDQLSLQYGTPLAANAHIAVTTPELPAGKLRLRPARVETTLQLTGNRLDGKWQWRDVARIYRLDGTLTYRTDTQRGEIHAQSEPLVFRENGNYLPAIVKNWPYPLDFSSGQLSVQGQLFWDAKGVRGDGTLHTKQLGGFYNHHLFRGVDAHVRADYRDDTLSLQSQPITIAEITAGIPVRNIGGTLSANTDTVQLQNFSADLFGGKISQPALTYTLDAAENRLTLQLEQLQLAEILALQEGIEGTGTLDGSVPVRLSKTGLRVDGAQLQARPPGGLLRYQGATPASAVPNPALALALTALENFHYDSMAIRADFSLDFSPDTASGSALDSAMDSWSGTSGETSLATANSGDVLLGVTLKGRNPTAPDTPPVNFNLNIRENIPDLLRTLQIGDDISARIEQRIKTLQQQTPRAKPPPAQKR
ncbi:MAG: YdbH domain-containing protein, partial [Spongiibacteraceae bacterium]